MIDRRKMNNNDIIYTEKELFGISSLHHVIKHSLIWKLKTEYAL